MVEDGKFCHIQPLIQDMFDFLRGGQQSSFSGLERIGAADLQAVMNLYAIAPEERLYYSKLLQTMINTYLGEIQSRMQKEDKVN